MKHTPGPWKIDNSLDAVNEREATGMYQIITERGTVIAETMAEQGADLIAAAPDLLDLLVALRNEFQAWASSDEPRDPTWAEKRIRRINKAIKKAEGKS